ncbi:MAG: hypothetical protein V4565_04505 [Bacteroidota bacterium]
MTILDKISQLPDKKRSWTSIFITFTISSFLTLLGIYGIGQYGLALFILTPLFVGFCSTAIYGYNHQISRFTAFIISAVTLSLMTIALLVFALEGIICITMAMPLALLLIWAGSTIGYLVINKKPSATMITVIALGLFIPLTSFIESKTEANNIIAVTTSVTINASQEKVWQNVVVFPELNSPTEFLFKAGIAYPINATIDGKGEGAIRYCNFTTGSFVEPITKWDEPNLLSFNVQQSPKPMTELSFWDVDAPHLHDYFVSKKGQFKLVKISDNVTRLEGTTWYYNKIKPNFYWNIWSDYIVHAIHARVLNHIKQSSENNIL